MSNQIVNVPVNKTVFNRYQIDGTIDHTTVEDLKSSLRQYRNNGSKGLLQITRGRQLADGSYEQGFGRHRLIAFQELAQEDPFWSEMPMIVSELSDLEMFEMMGIENLQRRDISPIEEAQIFHIYMTQFEMTSVATAEKYEKSEEYVRQSIRLLNLPEPARKMVQEGTLNKTAARDLLVLNKMGGADLVKEALEELGKNPEFAPAETFEGVLRESDNVKWLDKNAEWFSANKNFPHKYLSALTKADLKDLLRPAKGISEIAAQRIEDLMIFISAGMEFADEGFTQINPEDLERLRVLINPTPCEKCPMHAVLNGDHYCGLPKCMERKKAAWQEKKVADVLKDLGVPMYQKSDGPFVKLSPYSDADKKLWKEKGPDLRLMPSRFEYNNFKGLQDDVKVVLVGKAVEKLLNKIEESKSIAQKEQANRKDTFQIHNMFREFRYRFMWEVVSRAFEPALEGLNNANLLAHLAERCFDYIAEYPEGVDEDNLLIEARQMKKNADRAKQLRRIVIHNALDMKVDNDFHIDIGAKKLIIKYAEQLQKVAVEWGVKLPKDFTKQAEQYQAELETALKAIKE